MKKWILKAIIQKGISVLPYKHQINYLFQKFITKGVQLSPQYFEDRLIHLKEHLSFYQKYRGDLSECHALELGTGWYPVIPIGLFLAGAKDIKSIDISPLTHKDKVLLTMKLFLEWEKAGQLKPYITPLPERLASLQRLVENAQELDLTALLNEVHISYLVGDARSLPLPDASVNFITSNNTFEHIYPAILKDILIDFKRVLQPKGLMSHFIDMSDHFAHLDPSISIYHFLRFSEKQWRWIDNDVQPQNRWRMYHYRELYANLGIPIAEEKNRPGDLIALHQQPIADTFSKIAEEELAISHGYVVSVKEGH